MNIRDAQKEAYMNAVAKGWHSEPRTFGDQIALCHSELSEALEEFRDGRGISGIRIGGIPVGLETPNPGNLKPEGIPIELADVVIRIFDICGANGIDLEAAVRMKMDYNATRPHRHGGKRI